MRLGRVRLGPLAIGLVDAQDRAGAEGDRYREDRLARRHWARYDHETVLREVVHGTAEVSGTEVAQGAVVLAEEVGDHAQAGGPESRTEFERPSEYFSKFARNIPASLWA